MRESGPAWENVCSPELDLSGEARHVLGLNSAAHTFNYKLGYPPSL